MLTSPASSLGNSPSSDARQAVQRLVQDALPAHGNQRAINGSSRLRDLGLSSLRLIALIISLENEFRLGEAELAQLNLETSLETVVALCATARQRLNSRIS